MGDHIVLPSMWVLGVVGAIVAFIFAWLIKLDRNQAKCMTYDDHEKLCLSRDKSWSDKLAVFFDQLVEIKRLIEKQDERVEKQDEKSRESRDRTADCLTTLTTQVAVIQSQLPALTTQVANLQSQLQEKGK